MSDFDDFQQSRINDIKALITALDAAILAVSSGSVAEYEFETGQSRTKVTKANLGEMRRLLTDSEQRLAQMCGQNGGQGELGVPAW